MGGPLRVTPEEVSRKLNSGEVFLVCAYEDDSKFRMMHLEGAISLSALESRLPSLPKDQEIVFY